MKANILITMNTYQMGLWPNIIFLSLSILNTFLTGGANGIPATDKQCSI